MTPPPPPCVVRDAIQHTHTPYIDIYMKEKLGRFMCLAFAFLRYTYIYNENQSPSQKKKIKKAQNGGQNNITLRKVNPGKLFIIVYILRIYGGKKPTEFS